MSYTVLGVVVFAAVVVALLTELSVLHALRKWKREIALTRKVTQRCSAEVKKRAE